MRIACAVVLLLAAVSCRERPVPGPAVAPPAERLLVSGLDLAAGEQIGFGFHPSAGGSVTVSGGRFQVCPGETDGAPSPDPARSSWGERWTECLDLDALNRVALPAGDGESHYGFTVTAVEPLSGVLVTVSYAAEDPHNAFEVPARPADAPAARLSLAPWPAETLLVTGRSAADAPFRVAALDGGRVIAGASGRGEAAFEFRLGENAWIEVYSDGARTGTVTVSVEPSAQPTDERSFSLR